MSNQAGNEEPATTGSVKTVYILYLISIIIGITAKIYAKIYTGKNQEGNNRTVSPGIGCFIV